MQYKRLCKILKDKGLEYQVFKNKIVFKVGNATFKIVYNKLISSNKGYYNLYNNCFIHSQTYMDYKQIKNILVSNF